MKKLSVLLLSVSFVIGIIITIGNVTIVAQERPDMQIDKATKERVVTTLIKELNEKYVFPEVAAKLDADLSKRWKNDEYAQITSANEFADALTEHVQAISKDKHLRVRFSEREIPIRTEPTEPTAEQKKRYEEYVKRINFGFEKVQRLDGNIGYIELRGFSDHEMGAKTVESAMNLLANTEALIFDLRKNGGGSPRMVALISSYLFGDEPIHLNSFYYRDKNRTQEFWTKPEKANIKFQGKDIYVLTSNRTFSAAEEFSYNLRNLKRATIVGETTGGGAHPGGNVRLDKHFQAFISDARAINPITKTNWEGVGVKPHVEVPKEIAFETAYNQALGKLLEKETNERTKGYIRNKIKENEEKIKKSKQ